MSSPARNPAAACPTGLATAAATDAPRRSAPGTTWTTVFDGFREALAANRAEFFQAVASGPFYGFNREGVELSEPVVANW